MIRVRAMVRTRCGSEILRVEIGVAWRLGDRLVRILLQYEIGLRFMYHDG